MTAPIQNLLLASLPPKSYRLLEPDLTPCSLRFGHVLYEVNARISTVYFPDRCLVSLLTKVPRHLPIEVGMVGHEGFVGFPLALGTDISPVRALVQGGGTAHSMSKAKFASTMQNNPPLQRVVLAYINALIAQITQTAVCNRFHVIDARLARWLLMTRDRVGSGEFRMTQSFLGSMLGVRREGVTEAASAFQRRKLIEYSRGAIRILNHRGLEAASCSCYPLATDKLAPWRPRTAD